MSLYEPSRAMGEATVPRVRDVGKTAVAEGRGGREREGKGHFCYF